MSGIQIGECKVANQRDGNGSGEQEDLCKATEWAEYRNNCRNSCDSFEDHYKNLLSYTRSLYTSIMPNLLVPGIAEAIETSRASLKVFVCNVATERGETDGYTVEAHVAALVRHMPGELSPVDVVIAAR